MASSRLLDQVLNCSSPDSCGQHVLASQGPTWTEVTEKEEVERQRGAGKRMALFVGKEPREASKAFAAFKEAAAKV